MAAPNKWTRERVRIGKTHTDRANALVTSGAFEGRGHEWADTTFPGLILRVGRQAGRGTSRPKRAQSGSAT